MPATFEDAFERVKELAATFKANEKFYVSQQYAPRWIARLTRWCMSFTALPPKKLK
ncbi:MAG: hypothetical protein ACLPYZ_01430 [Limisphaerales bacterium]